MEDGWSISFRDASHSCCSIPSFRSSNNPLSTVSNTECEYNVVEDGENLCIPIPAYRYFHCSSHQGDNIQSLGLNLLKPIKDQLFHERELAAYHLQRHVKWVTAHNESSKTEDALRQCHLQHHEPMPSSKNMLTKPVQMNIRK